MQIRLDHQEAYHTDIQTQRDQRAQQLLADRGFLTLAGLYWLQEGDNRFGTDPAHEIVLPPGTTPAFAGLFQLNRGNVVVCADPTVELTTADGTSIDTMPMRSDQSDSPDYIKLGSLTMLILQRGERYAVRLYDSEHSARSNFSGLCWYPVDPAYRITGEFIAYDPPKMLPIVDVIGHTSSVPSPGFVRFTWQGASYRLDAQARGERLFYNFRDRTNGNTTYGAGRFLFSPLPQPSDRHIEAQPMEDQPMEVVLDFNQATNPFCAYTSFATCPLPPPENHLDFQVEAGEMTYPGYSD